MRSNRRVRRGSLFPRWKIDCDQQASCRGDGRSDSDDLRRYAHEERRRQAHILTPRHEQHAQDAGAPLSGWTDARLRGEGFRRQGSVALEPGPHVHISDAERDAQRKGRDCIRGELGYEGPARILYGGRDAQKQQLPDRDKRPVRTAVVGC